MGNHKLVVTMNAELMFQWKTAVDEMFTDKFSINFIYCAYI